MTGGRVFSFSPALAMLVVRCWDRLSSGYVSRMPGAGI